MADAEEVKSAGVSKRPERGGSAKDGEIPLGHEMSGHRLPTRQRRLDRVAGGELRKNRVVGRERLELGERQHVPVMRRTVPTQAVQLGRLRQADRL